MIPGWTHPESPFHAGELAAQDRLGVRTALDTRVRRAGIRDYMPDQHRTFFSELPFLLAGHLDNNGQPWATLWVGPPGFMTSPDEYTLRIAGTPLSGDPSGALHAGDFVGALGIQFHMRRRNRINGTVATIDDDGITLAVNQSYGNCNKYIQARELTPMTDRLFRTPSTTLDADKLSAADQALIGQADTLFIASANLNPDAGIARGADISHKGGRPGFVRVVDAHTLILPDFTGNAFFNTIGNLACDSRAGLLFLDFDTGDLLYAAARADILWDDPGIAAFDGAQRLLRFHIQSVRRCVQALPFRWTPPQYAAELARTGAWKS